jgi:uncharacterized tellurite resistance protein B-like protein
LRSAIFKLLGLAKATQAAEDDAGGFSGAARVAAVALLHRMAGADFETREEERQAVLAAIGRLLGEPPAEAARVLEEARRHAAESVSLFDFTSVLHRQLDAAQKREVIELLWSVAFADGEVDPQEEYLVRKVARLLHLSDADFIAAKQRVRDGH